MDLRCLFGFHDWVYLESTTTNKVVCEYVEELRKKHGTYNEYIPTIYYNGSLTVENRVCLRCNLVSADVDDFKEILPDMYNEELEKKRERDERIARKQAEDMETEHSRVISAQKIFEERS